LCHVVFFGSLSGGFPGIRPSTKQKLMLYVGRAASGVGHGWCLKDAFFEVLYIRFAFRMTIDESLGLHRYGPYTLEQPMKAHWGGSRGVVLLFL